MKRTHMMWVILNLYWQCDGDSRSRVYTPIGRWEGEYYLKTDSQGSEERGYSNDMPQEREKNTR